MMTNTFNKLCICLILFVVSIVACKEKEKSDLFVFKYNQAAPLNSLDPAFAKDIATVWATSHVYETLFIYDSNTELTPLLIEDYIISNDKKTYHFVLKDDIYFHNNQCFKGIKRKLNSEDVQYSLLRLLDPKVASTGSWILNGKLDSLNPIEIVDSLSFKIHLSKPNAQFIHTLAMQYTSIVPKEAINFYGNDFFKNPVGTGAFRFKLWDEGNVLFLEKNTNYHLRDQDSVALPYLDMLKITFNQNKKSELLDYEKGNLSIVNDIDITMIESVFDDAGLLNSKWAQHSYCYKEPYLCTEYLAILMDSSLLNATSPLVLKNIRKAIAYGIDRVSISKQLKLDLTLPANQYFIPKGMPNYDTTQAFVFNPVKSKELIHQSGFDENNKPKITLSINNSNVEVAEFIANTLNTIGFEAEIKLYTDHMLYQVAKKGHADFFRRAWIADYPDAENYYSCFYSKNSTPPNYSRFNNSSFDELYEKCKIESNSDKRKTLYKLMDEILIEECPVIPLFYYRSVRLHKKNVNGLKQNSLNLLDLKYVNKK